MADDNPAAFDITITEGDRTALIETDAQNHIISGAITCDDETEISDNAVLEEVLQQYMGMPDTYELPNPSLEVQDNSSGQIVYEANKQGDDFLPLSHACAEGHNESKDGQER